MADTPIPVGFNKAFDWLKNEVNDIATLDVLTVTGDITLDVATPPAVQPGQAAPVLTDAEKAAAKTKGTAALNPTAFFESLKVQVGAGTSKMRVIAFTH